MKNKRIPTILGTLLLLVIVFFGVWLSGQTTHTQSKASGDCSPSGVQTANLTNKSVDISFITTDSCQSSLSINDKTIQNFSQSSTVHYFRVDNLSASTNYQFKAIVGGQEYREESFTFETAPMPSNNTSTANLAWGKILEGTNKASVGSIVYLSIPGAYPLSALTDRNGQWHISMSNSFTEDKSSLFTPATTGSEDIVVYSPDGQITQVENDLQFNDPVPDVYLGQGFQNSIVIPTDIPPELPQPTSFSVGLGSLLTIKYPTEGESITALRPDIFGTSKNNTVINFSLDSAISGTVTSKADGSWNWSPSVNLSLGNHTLVATAGNDTVQRKFSIISPVDSTSPLSFSATPSATVVPIATPTTVIPTVRTGKVSTKSGIPVTGNTSPLYLLLLSSLLTVSFSLYFFNKDEK